MKEKKGVRRGREKAQIYLLTIVVITISMRVGIGGHDD